MECARQLRRACVRACLQLPGSALAIADIVGKKINVLVPVDAVLAANGAPSLYDIAPDVAARSTTVGGLTSFTIGGANFHNMGALSLPPGSVTCGGGPADRCPYARPHLRHPTPVPRSQYGEAAGASPIAPAYRPAPFR